MVEKDLSLDRLIEIEDRLSKLGVNENGEILGFNDVEVVIRFIPKLSRESQDLLAFNKIRFRYEAEGAYTVRI